MINLIQKGFFDSIFNLFVQNIPDKLHIFKNNLILFNIININFFNLLCELL